MSSRKPLPDGLLGSAGWLMAELAMILMLIMAGSEGASQMARSQPPPTPVETTPSPTSTPVGQPGLVPDPLMLKTPWRDGDYRTEAQDLADQIAAKQVQPGLVLLWGIGSEKEGQKRAAGVRTFLQPLLDSKFAVTPAIRAYYKGTKERVFEPDHVYAEIFYFAA